MCLVVVAQGAGRYKFVMAANRDELHARPTRAARWWPEAPELLGGRDLVAGGTWLGVDRRGRIAAVTNVRDSSPRTAPRSRGSLVTDYFGADELAASFAAEAAAAGANFAPFNLLLFDGTELYYASNRAPAVRLPPAVHALSNAPLGVHWPKIVSAGNGAAEILARDEPLEPLFDLLAERSSAEPAEERYRSTHFVVGPVYGTRCSTVILIEADGMATFVERSFDAGGLCTGEVRETFAVQS